MVGWDCSMPLLVKYIFHVTRDDQVKSITGGALSFNSDFKLFGSCRGRSNEYGVGVWDQVSGKQVDFFYEPLGWSLAGVEWLHVANCLLVATLFPRKDNRYISLLDFRDKERMVWAWSDVGRPVGDERRVKDAIAMEECGSMCGE